MGADDDKIEEASNPEIRKNIRRKYGISDEDFVIMTGGKIDPWKTQTLLLMEAVAKINNPKVKLIVFGSVTPDLKEQVAARCIEDKVMYIGWIQSSESYKYFSAADLVVFPGRHSVFWEQVAGMGIPMVCKYWEGTTHVDAGGNVKLLKNDSVEEIYDVLMNILDGEYKRIICEKYIDSFASAPTDYKFYCFYGKPEMVLVVADRGEHTRKHFYDMNWNFISSRGNTGELIEKPESLEEMIDCCKKLASQFPFVRMDFYEVNGRAMFGEMTFTPAGGIGKSYSPEVYKKLGDLLVLPKIK